MEPVLTLAEARELLGVRADVDARALRRAWASALQATRPDYAGDDATYRQVIAAYRLLKATQAVDDFVLPPAPWRPPPPQDVRCELIVSPAQALAGVWRTLRFAGRVWRLKVPPGAVDRSTLRLRGAAPGGADLLVALRVPRPAPQRTESLRRRFVDAWAA